MGARAIARWESKGHAYYVTLYKQDGSGWSYRASEAGGYLGNHYDSDEQVIEEFEKRVNDFQPDSNKTPMRRIF